jgi:hypothetical protein
MPSLGHGYPSACFYLADSIHSFNVGKVYETDLVFLRTTWIIGPPFVDLKSLTTMSNTGGVDEMSNTGGGDDDKCGRLCLQNLVSIITTVG